MFSPREKWFRGSIFFSLKSLLVRRGESWWRIVVSVDLAPAILGKGISMVSWNSSSPNSSSFPEGQETRFEREEKRRKSLLRRARTWYSYTQTLFLGERCSSLPPLRHQGWAYALTWWQRLGLTDLNKFFCSRSLRLTRLTDSFDLTR